mmetsp:Transcript_2465/g.5370  ORF Transcript_2465/g.5370 Transcript_2465/m.5370 type:complete len:200 (-) Transcript_2465:127-726(-)
MLTLPWIGDPGGTWPSVLETVTLSPVRLPSSQLKTEDTSLINRASAGILSPTLRWIRSPGTSSRAGVSVRHTPERRAEASEGCIFWRASRAPSADRPCHTPTAALSTRMSRITAGSINACSPWWASKKEVPALKQATPRRICTSRSSNCSAMSSKTEAFGAASSSLGPNLASLCAASSSMMPNVCEVPRTRRVRSVSMA